MNKRKRALLLLCFLPLTQTFAQSESGGGWMERFNQIQRSAGLPEFVSAMLSKVLTVQPAEAANAEKTKPEKQHPKQQNKHHAKPISVNGENVTWRQFLDHRKPELAEKAKVWKKKSQAEAKAARKALAEKTLDIPDDLRSEATATNGCGITLIGLRNGKPVFEQTYNAKTAEAMGTDQL